MAKKQLWNVYYIDDTYGDPPRYEGTTNNIRLWIHHHNLDRLSDQISMDAMMVYDKLGLGGHDHAMDMEEAWYHELMMNYGYSDEDATDIADEMASVVEPEHYFEFEQIVYKEFSDKQIDIDKAING
jgi:hypothetical protein